MSVPSMPEALARQNRGRKLQQGGSADAQPAGRYYILGTFHVAMLEPLLVEALDREEIRIEVKSGPFGQLEEEILNDRSPLYATAPEGIVLVLSVEDLLSALYARPAGFLDDAAENLVQEQADRMRGVISALLERLPQATIYPVVVGAETAPSSSILAPDDALRGQAAVESMLRSLRQLGQLSPRVVVVDWDWLTRGDGTSPCRDTRLWYLARMRLNVVGLASVAESVALHVAAIRKPPRKVVVFDLDDTIWGGVVGEVGLAGLALGEDGIGRAFQDVQRELLKLSDTGILLAACSKNNPEDAWSAFDQHPGMVLQRKHLVASRVNWQDKATNLRELAKELNLGIDSFVFLDDNPVERELIRQMLPEVLVPELPEDPALRPDFVRSAPWFHRLRVTSEDRQRGESYRVQKLGTDLRASSATFEGFLASLAQEVTIEPVNQASVGRAVQLCQRTNQFNLTTPRYTLADLEQFLRNPAVELHTLSVRDRFGDHGITGLAIVRYTEAGAEIDTLLLSCRVLGRRVEDTLLSFLASRARDRGASQFVGKYIATPKNGQVSTFFTDRGFATTGDGKFALDLAATQLPLPSEIKLIAPQYAHSD
ncbi:MAG TPA: HAD-IIIC family phosphatase [Pirellulales bacterium]|nr:HAD-IIIC family phosphatase [Pirellulales bacterium]